MKIQGYTLQQRQYLENATNFKETPLYNEKLNIRASLGNARKSPINTTQKTKEETGYIGDNDITRNIYDLEANCYEWTAQKDEYGRAIRGGCYGNLGQTSSGPIAMIYDGCYGSNASNTNTTTRVTLYIK